MLLRPFTAIGEEKETLKHQQNHHHFLEGFSAGKQTAVNAFDRKNKLPHLGNLSPVCSSPLDFAPFACGAFFLHWRQSLWFSYL